MSLGTTMTYVDILTADEAAKIVVDYMRDRGGGYQTEIIRELRKTILSNISEDAKETLICEAIRARACAYHATGRPTTRQCETTVAVNPVPISKPNSPRPEAFNLSLLYRCQLVTPSGQMKAIANLSRSEWAAYVEKKIAVIEGHRRHKEFAQYVIGRLKQCEKPTIAALAQGERDIIERMLGEIGNGEDFVIPEVVGRGL